MSSISLVICTKNGAAVLRECLDSLVNQSRPPDEVLLVDGRSTDATRMIAAEYPVSIVMQAGRGIADARNQGIRMSRGEIIAFTDADCIAHRDWLSEIEKAYRVAGKEIGIVGSRPLTLNRANWIARCYGYVGENYVRRRTPFRGEWVATNSFSIRREVVDRVGGFDPAMVTGEDVELCRRVRRAGYAVLVHPQAIVHHRHRDTLLGLWRQSFGYGRGSAQLLQRRLGLKEFLGHYKTVFLLPSILVLFLSAFFFWPFLYGGLLLLAIFLGRLATQGVSEARESRASTSDAAGVFLVLLVERMARTAGFWRQELSALKRAR